MTQWRNNKPLIELWKKPFAWDGESLLNICKCGMTTQCSDGICHNCRGVMNIEEIRKLKPGDSMEYEECNQRYHCEFVSLKEEGNWFGLNMRVVKAIRWTEAFGELKPGLDINVGGRPDHPDNWGWTVKQI